MRNLENYLIYKDDEIMVKENKEVDFQEKKVYFNEFCNKIILSAIKKQGDPDRKKQEKK